uniref:Uncharacterized protein n=1 Tax=Sphaerodactylus townsendi TaxID=933632 RepID=A0ACB8EFY7_9SAUR
MYQALFLVQETTTQEHFHGATYWNNFCFPHLIVFPCCKETEIHFYKTQKKESEQQRQMIPKASLRNNQNSSYWKGNNRKETLE